MSRVPALRIVIIGIAIVTALGCSVQGPAGGPGGASPVAQASSPPSAAPSTQPAPSVQPVPSPSPSPAIPPGVLGVHELDFRPSGIVAWGDLIWTEDHAETNAVYAIDPATGETRASVSVSRPCDIVPAADRLWVADLSGGRVVSIDPASMAIGGEITGLQGPCGIQATDGALWLADNRGLARIDPKSGTVTIEELAGGAFPGSGTPLWAAMYDGGELIRIDTTTGKAAKPVPAPGGWVEGPPVAAGHGAVWYGDASNDRVYRLDPETGAVQAEIEATEPRRLLTTADAVWLTSYDGGVVERIDPATNQVVYRAQLGGHPNGITEGFGAIWVADTESGRLYRLDPTATSSGA